MLRKLSLGLLLTAIAFGCAKDKNVDDYQADEAKKNYAKLESVAGQYSGLLYSQTTNQVVSAMSITLDAGLEPPVAGTNGSATAGTPSLTTTVVLQTDAGPITIPMTNSNYDEINHSFSSELTIQPTTSAAATAGTVTSTGGTTGASSTSTSTLSHTIVIKARVEGGVMTGTLKDRNYANDGGTFTLRTSGGSLKDLSLTPEVRNSPLSTSSRELSYKTFYGKYHADGKPFSLHALYPAQSALTAVLNSLFPNTDRILIVTLEPGEYVTLTYSQVAWDVAAQTLFGTQAVSTSSVTGTLTLACDHFDFNATNYHFMCNFTGGTQTGLQQVDFSPSFAPVKAATAIHKMTKKKSKTPSGVEPI